MLKYRILYNRSRYVTKSKVRRHSMAAEGFSDDRDEIVMQNMTWPEISKAIEDGFKTVIVMLSSVEQHGPHLPINTDSIIADELAQRVARRLRHTLIAPTIRPGCSDHHLCLPGTISLRPQVLLEILRDYCSSLERHGFKKIILISSHGGNFSPLETFGPTLVREFPQLQIIHYGDLSRYMDLWEKEVIRLGIKPEKAGGHACLGETSEVLRLKPEAVRSHRLEPGFTGQIKGLRSRVFRDGVQVITKNGVIGDPRGSTPEVGEALLEKMSTHLAEWADSTN
jgi:creatinine amidohydrolase